MAANDDTARLLVSIEATQAKFEKQLAAVAKAAERAAKKTEDTFRSANDNVAKGFDRSTAAMRQQGFAAKQLSAQFGDIAAQIAAGTSPLRAVATQADQIRMALQSAGGAANAFRALAGAVFNPITLATTAFTLLGERAIAYFTSVGEGTEAADTALKAHIDLVEAVTREWGDAVPSLKAYAEEVRNATNIGQLREATAKHIDQLFADAREQMAGLGVDLTDVVTQLRAAGAEEEGISRIQDAFRSMKEAVDSGNDSTKQAQELTAALASSFSETGVTAADSFAGSINRVAGAFAEFAKQAAKARAEAEAAIQARTGAQGSGIVPFNPLPADDTNRRVQLQAARESIAGIESSGNYRALGPILENGDRAYGRYQVMGRNIADWTKRAIGTALTPEQFLNNPQFQDKVFDHVFGGYIEQFGMQGASEAWFAGPGGVGKSNRKDALGTSVGDYSAKFTAGLGEVKDAWAGLRDVTASTKEETAALTTQYADFGQVAQTAVQGLANALADGKLEGKELLQILMQVVQQLLTMPPAGGGGLFGGGGGFLSGILGSIFHKGGVAGGPAPQRMVSPSTFAGAKRYHTGGVAGLMPGEVPAILQRGEVVLPRGTKAQGGGETITINLRADDSVIAEVADQRIQTATGTIVRVAVQESNKRVVPTMAKYQSEKAGGEWR
ncbi:hypothetical protein GOC33_05505 [Sinorhizobium meliloti]|nr:hypothetical protein [Sinorhizobium meliloti]